MLSEYQQQQIQKMSHLLAFSSVNFGITLATTLLLYPISKEVIAPIMAFIVPLSHASLGKTLVVVSVMYWLPVLYRCMVIALRKESMIAVPNK
jgi:uncharacterized membrane protein